MCYFDLIAQQMNIAILLMFPSPSTRTTIELLPYIFDLDN